MELLLTVFEFNPTETKLYKVIVDYIGDCIVNK